jgi:hypothetical protein
MYSGLPGRIRAIQAAARLQSLRPTPAPGAAYHVTGTAPFQRRPLSLHDRCLQRARRLLLCHPLAPQEVAARAGLKLAAARVGPDLGPIADETDPRAREPVRARQPLEQRTGGHVREPLPGDVIACCVDESSGGDGSECE